MPRFRSLPHFAIALLVCLAFLLASCESGLPKPIATPGSTAQATSTLALPSGSPTTGDSQPSTTPAPTRTARATAATSPTPIFSGGTPTPTILPLAERQQLFDDVWQAVNDHYLYADFKGVDWEAVRNEFEPKALAAPSAPEFYAVLADMVGQLQDEHSYFLSPWQVEEEDQRIQGNVNYVGIGILYHREEGAMLIVYVIPGSPAEEAGLMRRDRIIRVNGEPLNKDEDEPTGVRGPVGSSVTLTVTSPERGPREVVVERRSIEGSIFPAANRLDADKSVGYLFVPDLWTGNMSQEVDDRLDDLLDGSPLTGLILDLRGNGGGLRTTLEGILGQFVTGRVGDFYSNDKSYPLIIRKGTLYEQLKSVPMVVLVDEGTVSYGEVLAGVLQTQGRAKVVGMASLGNTETIYPYDFDDGSRVWVAQEGFKLPNGVNLEGKGVIPDSPSDKDWTRYSERNDPHIVEALELLKAK